MPGLMSWPRRSLPFDLNRMMPIKEPWGTSGSVTFCSPEAVPFGAADTSQISLTTPFGPVIFAPSFWRVDAIAAGTSEGGAPAESALYWAAAAAAGTTPQTTIFHNNDRLILLVQQ